MEFKVDGEWMMEEEGMEEVKNRHASHSIAKIICNIDQGDQIFPILGAVGRPDAGGPCH